MLFRKFLLTILIMGFVGFIGYLSVPAVGPGIAFKDEFQINLVGRLSESALSLVDTARAPRDVFPSLHVGMATLVILYARKMGRLWFFIVLPICLGNWFSTIYLRYHYLIDVIAGWMVAALAVYLTAILLRVETMIRLRAAAALNQEDQSLPLDHKV